MAVIFAQSGDEIARWDLWWQELHLTFSGLTGPLAPHMLLGYTVFLLLEDLIMGIHRGTLRLEVKSLKDCGHLSVPVTAWPGAPASHPLDIVCCVRQRMSSRRIHQVLLLVPGSQVPFLNLAWNLRVISARLSLQENL